MWAGEGYLNNPGVEVTGLFCLGRHLPGHRFGLKGLDLAFCLLTDQVNGFKRAFVIIRN